MRLPTGPFRLILAGVVALMASTAAGSPAPKDLHRDAIVVDLHSDTLLDVAAKKRDISVRSTAAHIDLPRLREGGVDVQVFAVFVHPRFAGRGFARATELIDAFDHLVAARSKILAGATTVEEIERQVKQGKIVGILAIENGSAVEHDLTNVDRLVRRGVRMMSLTWNQRNALADGAMEQQNGGLTPFGRQVVARMQELGMVIDVSHLSERSFWDVLAASRGPLMATHSNAAGLTPQPRNLADEQLRAIAAREGVVGVNFYPPFTGGPSLERVLDHIDYLVKVMGVDHVALGSDFDGFSERVRGLEDVSRLPNLTTGLLARGYSAGDIRKILGGNALRVFKQVWGR